MEIKGFIRSYQAIYGNVEFDIVRKGDKPDYRIRDKNPGEEFGVELTSVYLNDRSVSDEHTSPIPESLTTIGILHDVAEVEEYKRTLVETIKDQNRRSKEWI